MEKLIKAIDIKGFPLNYREKDLFVKRNADKEDDDSMKIVRTACKACISNCGVLAHVKNGHVVKLEGDPADPMSKGRMCAKGLAGIQALYHPNRNKYPLKRVGERGGGKWKRLTWDEALTDIAGKLVQTYKDHGAESLTCSTGGGGNPEFYSIGRFCNIFGTPNWFEPGCAQCYLPRNLAYGMMYGGADTSIADGNSLEIYKAGSPIKCLVLWGTVPSYSCPPSGGAAVVELRSRGVKTICVDPRLTPDAAKADVWLPVRPGTDVALMFSWIRYIMENELYDKDFVMKWTNLPYLVDLETNMLLRAENEEIEENAYMIWDCRANKAVQVDFPMGEEVEPALSGEYEINGKQYKTGYQLLWERVEEFTLEKAARICYVDKDDLEKAIRIYAENTPGGLALGVATDQNPNSVQAAMAAATLDILMGNVERPGSLMQRFEHSGCLSETVVPVAEHMLSDEQLKKRLGGVEYKGLLYWLAAHPTSILDAIMTGKPYKPRVWIDRSGNKMSVLAQPQKWEKAIHELEYIVHMHMIPTSFSAYADIILPTKEWLETEMLVETCNMLLARQSAAHVWDTIDETLIWSMLAKKCAELGHEGCQKSFDPEIMGEELPYWDTMDELFDTWTENIGMTWKEFKEQAPMPFMSEEEWSTYYIYKEIDEETGKPAGFDTPSKKLEVYLESLIPLGRTGEPFSPCELPPASKDYDPLPYYIEPYESPLRDDEIANEYPLVLTNGRIPFYHHSTLRNIPGLREMSPVPELWLHPQAAEKYGIETDDWVWVESPRGKTRAKAHVTEGINPGVAWMERFWTPETLQKDTHGWKEMNVNLLTKADGPFNDIVGTYTLRGILVKVYKADGPPEGVWTKPEDFKSWLPVKAQNTDKEKS